ncbi:monovalent cation/H(+) antiporter subunit G [Nesterenkonia xinjiangensis]|uniref:Multicomponent Na+:H+ antiporter subunit G n=1 Tax=Nesterenkonia xinjiangensis TaxID=225327 RepID=A0A7Z0KCA6_9MICC|nr:monovalent cation/H(+) antiporter subunit G [Nesterenkonia xinjiangensis]NYJ78457.1 multicomponent Na+:H+ antiporter subunit G [Nesterenkonia xinjiangensis]
MMDLVDVELMDQILDAVAAVFLVIGGLMSLAAGIGLVRLPDLHSRMHAATKPQVLGLLSLLLAAAITWRSWSGLVLVLLAWGLQILTAPASAHVVGRAGYRTKHFKSEQLAQDELARAVDRISHGHGARREIDGG